jgi:hypothetical protein
MMRLTILSLAALVLLLTMRQAPSTKLDFTARYDGRGAEGIDDIWRGTLDTPDAGAVVMRIERRSTPSKVHALVFVSHDSLVRSFGADVTGRQTDDSTIQFKGHVDVGRASGTAVEVTMHGHHGTITLLH